MSPKDILVLWQFFLFAQLIGATIRDAKPRLFIDGSTRPSPMARTPSPTLKPPPSATRPSPTVKPPPLATRPSPSVKPPPSATRPSPTENRPFASVTRPTPTAKGPSSVATRPSPTATRPSPSVAANQTTVVAEMCVMAEERRGLKEIVKTHLKVPNPRWIGVVPSKETLEKGTWYYWHYKQRSKAEDLFKCSDGQMQVLDLLYEHYLRFEPREFFGFARVKIFHYDVQQTRSSSGQTQTPSCVQVPTAAKSFQLAFIIPPRPSYLEIKAKKKDAFRLKEDENDDGQLLSDIVEVYRPPSPADSPTAHGCIPQSAVDELNDMHKKLTINVCIGVQINAPEDTTERDKLDSLGRVEFKVGAGRYWQRFIKGETILPLNARVRMFLRPNANGNATLYVLPVAYAVKGIQGLRECDHVPRKHGHCEEVLTQNPIKEIVCRASNSNASVAVTVASRADPPTVNDDIIYAPPWMFRDEDPLNDQGFSVEALLKTSSKIVYNFLTSGNGDKLKRKLTEFPEGPEAIKEHIKKLAKESGYFGHPKPVAEDADDKPLGIIVTSMRENRFVEWFFKIKSSSGMERSIQDTKWTRVALKSGYVLVLKPRDEVKPVPKPGNGSYWSLMDALEFCMDFKVFRVSSDMRPGVQQLDINTLEVDKISQRVVSLLPTRLGCNGKPANITLNSCGKCSSEECPRKCDGTFNSNARTECNGVCVGGNTGRAIGSTRDCFWMCGNAKLDKCGVCQRSERSAGRTTSPGPGADCAGVCPRQPYFGAKRGCNGKCVGGSTGFPENHGKDACGVCGGDNSTCKDCRGEVNGPHKVDDCGECAIPHGADFNECFKLELAESASFSSDGGDDMGVVVIGVTDARTTSCSFVKGQGATRIELDQVEVRPSSQKKSRFSLITKPAVAGEYSLECSFGSKVINSSKRITIYDAGFQVTGISPSRIRMNTKTNITVTGSGFVHTPEMKCLVEMQETRYREVFPLFLVNNNKAKCAVDLGHRTGVMIFRIAFSMYAHRLTKDTKRELSVEGAAPRALTCKQTIKSPEVSMLVIDFDVPVRPGKVRCKDILENLSLEKVDGRSSCIFEKNTLIVVSRPLVEGESVTIKNKMVKNGQAKLTDHNGVAETSKLACPADATDPPQVELSGNNKADICGTFRLQISMKNIRNPRVNVTTDFAMGTEESAKTSEAIEDLKKLKRKIEAFLSKGCKSIRIDEDLVLPGTTKTITVTINDAKGNFASASHDITRKRDTAPILSAIGGPIRTHDSSRDLKIRVRPEVSKCGRADKKRKYEFFFECDDKDRVNLKSDGNPFIKVSRKELKGGKNYTFTARVVITSQNESQTASTSIKVIIPSKPLKCSLGTRFRDFGRDTPLVEFAGEVADPDNDVDTPLEVFWTCEDQEGSLCSYEDDDGVFQWLTIANDIKTSVNVSRLRPARYRFNLTVTKGPRSCHSLTWIRIRGEVGVPTIKMIAPSDKVNPNDVAHISASVKNLVPKGIEVVWYSIEKDGYSYLVLDGDSTTYNKLSTEVKGNSAKRLHLVLREGVLNNGAKYAFGLEARNQDGNVIAKAEGELETIDRPTAGLLSIEPAEGVARNTTFTFAATEGWEDKPLKSYEIRCLSKTDTGRKEPKSLGPPSTDKTFNTILMAGDPEDSDKLEFEVKVCDDSGACSTARQSVTVHPRVPDVEEVASAEQRIVESTEKGDIHATQSLLSSYEKLLEINTLDDDMLETVKQMRRTATNQITKRFLSSPSDDETQKSALECLTKTLKGKQASEFLSMDEEEQLIDSVFNAVKPTVSSQEGRRRRRATEESTVVEKTAAEVEAVMDIYKSLLSVDDFDSPALTVKDQFIEIIDELGTSLCKGLSVGQPAVTAESADLGTLRSEKNDFSLIDSNMTPLSCQACTKNVTLSAHALLGKSLQDEYASWTCSAEACSGACVVSSQV
ncbi:uncharacterized protein LOC116603340 isoform X2 [Nematostella vectensis]|uniref:uncharacterized protein LOC116603340 isoform X2 n=1 Tax=Nematostella vectensis TaxID=45351 RepID=UPI002076DB0A|nr:uncharacterized protein LOC116603340 isoform X2 [Nematostella vectensis]